MRGPNPLKKFKNIGVMTVPFGGETRQEAYHPGIDIANESGTPIHAPVDGVVTNVDDSHIGVDNSFGNTLELKDAEGQTHQFHHLQNIGVQPGQQITMGTPIATIGKTGAVYSESGGDPSSLDYRIVTSYKKYLNPMTYVSRL